VREGDRYLICDYYAGSYVAGVKASDIILSAEIVPHGANVFKVCRMQEKPFVVKSTGHYSMGGEFDVLELSDGKLHYAVDNPFDCPIEYSFLLQEDKVISVTINRGRHEEFR